MNRYELKFLIPESDVDRVRREVERYVELDEHARPSGSYVVHSIYFDTSGFDCYHEKLAGIMNRRKVRIRGYDDGGEDARVFLEIKRKDDMLVSKTRARLDFRHVEHLLHTGDVDGMDSADSPGRDGARAFMYNVRKYSMRPVLLVRYVREAFTAQSGLPLRLTIDRDVRSAAQPEIGDLYEPRSMRDVFPGHAVLEAKFPRQMPPWLAAMVDRFGYERDALSKYTQGLDAVGVASPDWKDRTVRRVAPTERDAVE